MFEDQKKFPQPAPVPTSDKPDVGAGLDVPKSAVKSSSSGPIIHVMPGEYYGVAPRTSVKKTEPVSKPVPPPSPPPKPVPPFVLKKKSRFPFLLIIGLLFVLVIAIGGYLFLRSARQPAPSRVATAPSEPTEEPEPAPPPPPPPVPEPIRPGIDTDSDGLTDVEERTIYGSDPRHPDTDGDSFIDGNEVLHLYDPTQQSPALIEEDGIFVTYHPFGGRWQILIPKGWKADPPDPFAVDELTYARLAAPSGEMIIFEFPEQGDGAEPQQFVSSDVRLLPFRSKSGLEGWRSVDQRLIIIRDGGIILIRYELGEKRSIDFLRTFEMMVNSYVLPIGGPIE